jgi:hypothetical protein
MISRRFLFLTRFVESRSLLGGTGPRSTLRHDPLVTW